ncbi:MAG TPA: cell division protein ZapE [Gammaproteobacteria bacterium]|nr:cell division protein ZapE [Gammaproteobacteria bacterium]
MNDARPPQSPRQRYEADLIRNGFQRDPAQERAVTTLDQLYARLLTTPPPSFWRRLTGRPTAAAKGLYLWGGVGRGKTWLMDCFYECLPFEDKLRLHFHRFMHEVHAALKRLPGEQDPLLKVAEDLRSRARVICFDEFFVSDITDAMLLGRLFQHLFARGLTLVATSNVAPDELYKNGLQRERFLPAIRLLKQHTQVLNVDGGTDYRLRHMQGTELFYVPAGPTADAHLMAMFERLAGHRQADTSPLMVNERTIPTRRHADGVAWFSFQDLCTGPRSQEDYIEIARGFHTVLLSDIPRLDRDSEDAARRFIALIDEFYDRRVKFVASAAVPLDALYAGKRLGFEFQRAISRLTEMQAGEYLSQAHLP